MQFLEVKDPVHFIVAFERANRERAEILFIDATPMIHRHHREIADLAAKSHLPAIASDRSFVEAGLLMSYGVHEAVVAERRAVFVDKILKGARPADIPIEQATKFELVINLKTAKALGLTIPPSVLARADEVIE